MDIYFSRCASFLRELFHRENVLTFYLISFSFIQYILRKGKVACQETSFGRYCVSLAFRVYILYIYAWIVRFISSCSAHNILFIELVIVIMATVLIKTVRWCLFMSTHTFEAIISHSHIRNKHFVHRRFRCSCAHYVAFIMWYSCVFRHFIDENTLMYNIIFINRADVVVYRMLNSTFRSNFRVLCFCGRLFSIRNLIGMLLIPSFVSVQMNWMTFSI